MKRRYEKHEYCGPKPNKRRSKAMMKRHHGVEMREVICEIWYTGYNWWPVSMVVLGSFFFHPRKSGCSISGYADGGLEVHIVPLLRQPRHATSLLTYLPALLTVEVSSQMRNKEQI
ncbi:hypothetical protein EVAR_70061_1 [Eumeta japonica]|uniref:Uncharacterized protein n=1 Tax=Eumeta variegata TaxID=151549 RepID=A0A4C2ACS7_EUMVA|nr:hypothetical protein EVAR_70061_1 [Eumeta japonica]